MRTRLALLFTLAAACNTSSPSDCPDAGTLCGKTCTLLKFDPANCGSCGNACAAGELCLDGACSACAPGLDLCASGCTDLTIDSSNCGSCTHQCNPGEACRGGVCTLSCPSGTQLCSNVCVDNGRDPNNCGDCGHACKTGELCVNGGCQFDCPSPFTACTDADGGSYCADPLHDGANCGGCGNTCGAGQLCVMGHCALDCPGSFKLCPTVTVLADGGVSVNASDAGVRCVDPQTDPLNCGGCGNDDTTGLGDYPHLCIAAPGLNDVGVCVMGSCASSCAPGFLHCDSFGTPTKIGLPDQIVCIDPTTDSCDCGGCGNACDGWGDTAPGSCQQFVNVPNQVCCSSACQNQLLDSSCGANCQVAACDGGTPTCCPDSLTNGGACTDLQADPRNCGSCSNDCILQCGPNAVCVNGSCQCS
ncbi:MAG: MXAN_6577-like cysteine-rich protein [Myxococcaceae bacterium]